MGSNANLRSTAEEILFRGLQLVFQARSRCQAVIRVDDEKIGELPKLPILDLMPRIDTMMEQFVIDGVEITAATKTTLTSGYLLSFHLGNANNGRSALVTVELVRN